MQYLKRANSILILLLLLSACFLIGCQTENIEDNIVHVVEQEVTFPITRFDQEIQWQDGEEINLSEKPEQCVITDGGNYLITGQAVDGLIVEAEDQNVHLFLDNVTIDTNAGPAIWIRSAGKVVITLIDGSSNVLSDYPSPEESINADAALFCVSDLTINGSGSLEVSGYHKDAIYSKDILKILGGNIVIRSKNDGLRGSDGIILTPESLSVESEQTGIRTTNTGKAGKGSIDICGGHIDVVAGEYGIHAAADLYINDASVTCRGVIADVNAEGHEYITNGCMN